MNYLIINPIGGLANRMRALASGVALAQQLGWGVRVVWPVNAELCARFDDLFLPPEAAIEVHNVSALADRFLYDIPRKKNLYLSYFTRRFRVALSYTDTPEGIALADEVKRGCPRLLAVKGPVLVRSGMTFHDAADSWYPRLFRPHPRFVESATRLLQGDERVIGLHIRRTDNAQSIAHSPDHLFRQVIDEALAARPEQRFYLATDSPEVKQDLLARYGAEHILTYSGAPINRDTLVGMEAAWVELLALSRCERIYGSYWSSFSEAAALFGNIPLVQLTAAPEL